MATLRLGSSIVLLGLLASLVVVVQALPAKYSLIIVIRGIARETLGRFDPLHPASASIFVSLFARDGAPRADQAELSLCLMNL